MHDFIAIKSSQIPLSLLTFGTNNTDSCIFAMPCKCRPLLIQHNHPRRWRSLLCWMITGSYAWKQHTMVSHKACYNHTTVALCTHHSSLGHLSNIRSLLQNPPLKKTSWDFDLADRQLSSTTQHPIYQVFLSSLSTHRNSLLFPSYLSWLSKRGTASWSKYFSTHLDLILSSQREKQSNHVRKEKST